jgi:hypothetical protein
VPFLGDMLRDAGLPSFPAHACVELPANFCLRAGGLGVMSQQSLTTIRQRTVQPDALTTVNPYVSVTCVGGARSALWV